MINSWNIVDEVTPEVFLPEVDVLPYVKVFDVFLMMQIE